MQVTSVRAQLPFSYYSLPVCKPPVIEDAAENLGEVLSGDVIENSAYEIKMMIPSSCKVLCPAKMYGPAERAIFRDRIQNKVR